MLPRRQSLLEADLGSRESEGFRLWTVHAGRPLAAPIHRDVFSPVTFPTMSDHCFNEYWRQRGNEK